MTAPDLPSRLLAAIAEVERNEHAKIPFGHPPLLLSLCTAHREIVNSYALTVRLRDEAAARLRTQGQRTGWKDLDTWARASGEADVIRPMIETLARGYGLNSEGSSPIPEIHHSQDAYADPGGAREQHQGTDCPGGGVQDSADERDHGA